MMLPYLSNIKSVLWLWLLLRFILEQKLPQHFLAYVVVGLHADERFFPPFLDVAVS